MQFLVDYRSISSFTSLNLPKDIIVFQIFSECSMTELAMFSLVSKDWNRFVKEIFRSKRVEIMKSGMMICPDVWNVIFKKNERGLKCVSRREAKLARRSIPPNLFEMKCPLQKGKSLLETHRVIWIPKKIYTNEMTLNNFEELCLKQKSQENNRFKGVLYIDPKVRETFGSEVSKKGHWVAITKEDLKDCRGKKYAFQREFLRSFDENQKKVYKGISIIRLVASMSILFFNEDKIPCENLFVRCRESLDRYHVVVNLSKRGFFIDNFFDNMEDIVVLGFKKLSS